MPTPVRSSSWRCPPRKLIIPHQMGPAEERARKEGRKESSQAEVADIVVLLSYQRVPVSAVTWRNR